MLRLLPSFFLSVSVVDVKVRFINAKITHPVLVNDLDDDGELAGGRALLNEDNTANLDVTLERSRHCV